MIATVIRKLFRHHLCASLPHLNIFQQSRNVPEEILKRNQGKASGIQVQIRRASRLEIHRLDGRLHRFDCRLLSRLWLEIHPHSHCSLGSSRVILWILSIAALPLWPWVLHCQTSGWSRGTVGNLVNGQGLLSVPLWPPDAKPTLSDCSSEHSLHHQPVFVPQLSQLVTQLSFSQEKTDFFLFLKETWQRVGEFIHLHNCALLAAPIRLFILYY